MTKRVKKNSSAEELDPIKLSGEIRGCRLEEDFAEFVFRVSGSVSFQGEEFFIDEEVQVSNCPRCRLDEEGNQT